MNAVNTPAFFEALAAEMNAHPERFRLSGEAYMSAGVVMRRDGGDFRVRLDFDGLRCDVLDPEGLDLCDYRLEGSLEAWKEMFDDIAAHGRVVGPYTVNSLVMLADRIVLAGRDPMGLDKFSRFNQTLQEFLDGAVRLAPAATAR